MASQQPRALNTKKARSATAHSAPLTPAPAAAPEPQAGTSAAPKEHPPASNTEHTAPQQASPAAKTEPVGARKRPAAAPKKARPANGKPNWTLPFHIRINWSEIAFSAIKLVLIEALFAILVLIGYNQFIRPAACRYPVWAYPSQNADAAVCTMGANDVLTQKIYLDEPICAVRLIATYAPAPTETPLYVIATLHDGITGEQLGRTNYASTTQPSYGIHDLAFVDAMPAATGVYELRISLLNFPEDHPVTVYTTKDPIEGTAPAMLNGVEQSASVLVNAGTQNTYLTELYRSFATTLLKLVLLVYLVYRCRFLHAAIRYLICAVLVGGLFCFVFPPFDSYDEYAHFATAYAYSAQHFAEEANEPFDETLHSYYTGENMPAQPNLPYLAIPARTGDEVLENLPYTYGLDDMVSYFRNLEFTYETENNTDGVLTMPVYLDESRLAYLPSTTGIIVGRNMGANAQLLPCFARAGSYLVYVLLCALGILAIPRGKDLLSVCALMPSALCITISAANDLYHCGGAILCIGLLLRLTEAKKLKPLPTALTLLCFGVCGYFVYAARQYQLLPLVLLAIVLLGNKLLEKRLKWYWRLLLLLGCGCACLLFWSQSIKNGTFTYVPPTKATASIGLEYVLCYPFEALNMIANTLMYNLDSIFAQWVGSLIGSGDFAMGTFPTALIAMLLIATGYSETQKGGYPVFSRIMFAVCGVGIALLSFCVGFKWTTMESYIAKQSLWGVQGRYFLSAMPLFLLSLRPTAPKAVANHTHTYALGMCLVDCYIMLNALWLIFSR